MVRASLAVPLTSMCSVSGLQKQPVFLSSAMKRQGVQPLIIESDSLVFDCDSFIFSSYES